jgi:hypothetical protein
MDLAVLVPSRSRPYNIVRLLEAMDRTCRGDTTLIVGVDEDDPQLDAYRTLTNFELEIRSGLKGRLVEWLNVLAVPRANEYRFIGHIGDDNVPRGGKPRQSSFCLTSSSSTCTTRSAGKPLWMSPTRRPPV